MQPDEGLTRTFGEIYSSGAWGDGVRVPRSGPNSDPQAAKPYVDFVCDVIDRCRVSSVVDIGHGDWQMWPRNAFKDVHYAGFDIADGLSTRVQANFGTPTCTFRQLDAVVSPLPSADLVLIKDVLQHLCNEDVAAILGKLRQYPRAIVSNDVRASGGWLRRSAALTRAAIAPRMRLHRFQRGLNPFSSTFARENSQIKSGGYRPLNLERSPWRMEDFGLRVTSRHDYLSPGSGPADLIVRRIWLMEPR